MYLLALPVSLYSLLFPLIPTQLLSLLPWEKRTKQNQSTCNARTAFFPCPVFNHLHSCLPPALTPPLPPPQPQPRTAIVTHHEQTIITLLETPHIASFLFFSCILSVPFLSFAFMSLFPHFSHFLYLLSSCFYPWQQFLFVSYPPLGATVTASTSEAKPLLPINEPFCF